ncbi:MAG: calcium-binding protein [Methylovirgula sp.]
MSKHPVSTILAVLSLVAAPAAVLPMASAHAANALTAADIDKDGTLDKAEVEAAAGAQFDKLDKDKEGTLDKAEVGKRLSKADFAAADPDNDKTLTKAEYTAAADKAFAAADANNDGTVDAKELHGKAGLALSKLIK